VVRATIHGACPPLRQATVIDDSQFSLVVVDLWGKTRTTWQLDPDSKFDEIINSNCVIYAVERFWEVNKPSWDWSRALCQMCSMSTRAWVVDRPLMAPNWLLSSFGNMRFIIHLPTYDSNSFDKVGVRDIGRKSDSMLPGGWTLGTGMTLACFHSWGKIPVLRDVLNIQHTGSARYAEKSRKTNLVFDQDLVTWKTLILASLDCTLYGSIIRSSGRTSVSDNMWATQFGLRSNTGIW